MSYRLTPFRPKITEKHVKDACVTLLKLRGYFPLRVHSGRARTLDGKRVMDLSSGMSGLPDFACMTGKGISFMLELKRPGGCLSNQQLITISHLTQGYGLAVAVVSSVEELARFLNIHEGKAC